MGLSQASSKFTERLKYPVSHHRLMADENSLDAVANEGQTWSLKPATDPLRAALLTSGAYLKERNRLGDDMRLGPTAHCLTIAQARSYAQDLVEDESFRRAYAEHLDGCVPCEEVVRIYTEFDAKRPEGMTEEEAGQRLADYAVQMEARIRAWMDAQGR